jgi:hypothetical protein
MVGGFRHLMTVGVILARELHPSLSLEHALSGPVHDSASGLLELTTDCLDRLRLVTASRFDS